MDPLMTVWVFFIGIIIGVIVGVALSYRTAVSPLHRRIKKLTSQQYHTFMKQYPYNPENFRYLGDPIDGIQFEDDKILLVSFKTKNTLRTTEQDHIKNLLKNGNVLWFEWSTK
jgi:predicted Holliday junction resolvase-like endonuclease